MKTKTLFSIAAVLLVGFFISCNKNAERVPVQIRLTDNPTELEAVNIHIKGMEVKVNNESWIRINSKDTIINLLDLRNGVTEVIAQDEIPDGVLKEIRFILDTDNTVVADGTTYPLETPSAAASGLKIKIDKRLQQTLNTFVLDFDAALSVKQEPGGYKLYPVIKLLP